MKTLLIALLLLPLCAAAQTFDVSLSAGVARTNILSSALPYFFRTEPLTVRTGALTFLVHRRRSSLGFSARVSTLHSITHSRYRVTSSGIDSGDYVNDEYYGRPSIEIAGILAHRYTIGHSAILVGGQLQVLLNAASKETAPANAVVHHPSGGAGIGFYFNYVYYIGHVGIGIKFTPSLGAFGGSDLFNLISVVSLPVQAGVHVSL